MLSATHLFGSGWRCGCSNINGTSKSCRRMPAPFAVAVQVAHPGERCVLLYVAVYQRCLQPRDCTQSSMVRQQVLHQRGKSPRCGGDEFPTNQWWPHVVPQGTHCCPGWITLVPSRRESTEAWLSYTQGPGLYHVGLRAHR